MFHLPRKFLRAFCITLLAGLLSLAPFSQAVAAKKSKNSELLEVDTSKSYTLPYALVVLSVTLGVILVARPTMRTEQVKRRKDEDEDDE
jgi:hypothetical protein